ncbi:pre-rRNA-processing protein IPI1 [Octopus vulgaris]|nr:pre-rRNA-processing protein IPI1 [Octopus vulgaris]
MGKAKQKLKKKKNEDFKKRKVKVGKKLPKKDNFTDTSFKTRTIQVLQHIRTKDPSLPTTKRNLSIKDLMSQCQHYNSTIRRDGVNGLRELLVDYPELLSENLSQIMQKIAELFIDKESNVRQANLHLLKSILPFVSENVLSPFFPLLSAHLCCAMTHIDEARQQHSLSILDLLLHHYPKQLIQNSCQLLPNFLQQISLIRQSHGKKVLGKLSKNNFMDSKSTRSLSVDPNSKLSSIKWRLGVLQRISKMLELIIAEDNHTVSGLNGSVSNCLTANGIHPNSSKNVVIQWTDYEEDQRVILRLNELYQVRKKNSSSGRHLLKDKSYVQRFIRTLIPLILECWVECCPEIKVACGESPISIESLPVLATLAELLKLICQYIDLTKQLDNIEMRGWLVKTYGTEMVQRIMTVFPYSTYTNDDFQFVDQPHNSSLNNAKDAQNLALEKQLNLDVCYVLSYLITDNRNCSVELVNKSLTPFLHYMESFLHKYQVKKKYVQLFVQIVVQLLSVDGNIKILQSLIKLIKVMLHSYNTVSLFSMEKVILTNFFLHLVEKHQHEMLTGLFEQFLSTLPALLVQIISHSAQIDHIPAAVTPILKAIKRAACQKQSSLQDQLQNELLNIFSLIPRVSAVLQRDMLEIVYRLDHFTDKQLNKIVLLSRSPAVLIENIAYILEILQHRLIRLSSPSSTEVNQYFTLLFSTALGQNQKELSSLPNQSDLNSLHLSGGMQGTRVLFSTQSAPTTRHCQIVKVVCSLLTSWPNTSQVQIFMDRLLCDLLERYALLSEETALGVINIGNAVDIHKLYMSQVTIYLTHLCHNVLHQLKYMNDTENSIWLHTNQRDELWHSAITFLKLPTHTMSQLVADSI